MRTVRQTNRQDEADSPFRNFANAPKYFAFSPQSVFMILCGAQSKQ